MSHFNKINGKNCVLENASFSWILHVDGKSINFDGSHNADYFSKHYKDLGYTVKTINNNQYTRNLGAQINKDPNKKCGNKQTFGVHVWSDNSGPCLECGHSFYAD